MEKRGGFGMWKGRWEMGIMGVRRGMGIIKERRQ